MSSLTEKQRAYHLLKMRTRFTRLDLNHDGFISRDDYELMAKKLKEYGKLNAEDAESTRNAFMTVADRLDLKPGVKISVEEAAQKANRELSVMAQEKSKASLKKTHDPIFDALDLDKNGHISLDEFKVYFQIVAPDISEDEMKHSFNVIDSNKNGKISREEFIAAAFDFIHGFEETEISKVFFGRLL
ncbi:sarcoplasmic calcium-binding [Paramuricea clavata]|uniref:Sarcoplasmic calcium-binding n=1 Tax=Paramuricea clavata TaxID=317549 RepID=A0A7D9DM81_PARCT|nr:sarcoplasmic calcium-binding [Paramuricea clavata]